jgi:HD-GYP domain-containing protein (c-di-GMP phosphodiesterase class II)
MENLTDQPIRTQIQALIEQVRFDLVEVCAVDSVYREILVTDAAYAFSVNPTAFDYELLADFLRRLAAETTGMVMTDQNCKNCIIRSDPPFSYHVLLPYFGADFSLAGFIYCGKITKPESDLLHCAEFTKILRSLIPLIEHRHNRKLTQTRLHETALLLAEIVNAKEPQNIARALSVFNWAKRIADALLLPQSDIVKLQLAVVLQDLGKAYVGGAAFPKAIKIS